MRVMASVRPNRRETKSWPTRRQFFSGSSVCRSSRSGSGRAAFCGILPPHILESIILHGTAEERREALATLTLSERFRERRLLLATLPVMALAEGKRRTV